MRLLPLLLLSLLAAPLAAAHGAPVVLDVEEHLIADEASDASYLWDGFDITNIYVREAYAKSLGQEGLIFRVMASGVQILGGEHTLELHEDRMGHIVMASGDGETWTSEHTILEQTVATDESTGALDVDLQVFVPMALNGTLGAVTATATLDGQTVDDAPGPLYIAGIPVAALGEGSRIMSQLGLDGPDGYTKSNVTFANGVLSVTVENLITTTGQHIFLLSDAQPDVATYTVGGTAKNGIAADVDASQDVTFTYELQATEPFLVRIQSDLGGQERYWVHPDGTVTESQPGVQPDPTNPDETTPGAALGLLLIGLVLVARRYAS